MKVLLISANTLQEPYPVYPFGLDYVAGAIAAVHEVCCLDLNGQEDNDGFPKQFTPLSRTLLASPCATSTTPML